MIDLNQQYQTRNGKLKTVQVTYLSGESEPGNKILAMFDNDTAEFYYEDGSYFKQGETDIDLVPVEPPKSCVFMNLYREGDDFFRFGQRYHSKEKAKDNVQPHSDEQHYALVEFSFDPATETLSAKIVEENDA